MKKTHDVMVIDDSDDEPLVPHKKPTPGKSKATVIQSSDEEDEEKPIKPTP